MIIGLRSKILKITFTIARQSKRKFSIFLSSFMQTPSTKNLNQNIVPHFMNATRLREFQPSRWKAVLRYEPTLMYVLL